MSLAGRAQTALFPFVAILLLACASPAQTAVVPGPAPPGAPAAQLIVEPDDGVQPVVAFVSQAHQTLDVAMYLLSDRDLIDALEASQRRGVRVRVMLEENPYGTGPGNRRVFDSLKGAGIAVRWGPPEFEFNHEKYAVADGRVALIGTANWTYSAFTKNREYLAEDSAAQDVQQLAALFEADWERQAAQVHDPTLVISPLDSRKDFLALIGSARRTIEIEAEEMEDPQITRTLVAAARRGVQVEVIVPSPTEKPDPNAAGEQALRAGGARVRELRQPYVHGKEVVVDGHAAFLGSENFSRTSLDKNREVGLLIDDAAVVKRLEETFRHDWQHGRP